MTVYETWEHRIKSGVLTKSQIQQFAQAISRQAVGMAPHGKRTNLTPGQCVDLAALLAENPARLTGEHTEQGLRWLRERGRKALSMPADVHDDVLANFSHFTWDGEITTTGPHDNGTLPVWTVVLGGGRQLRYYNGAWQSQPGEAAWWDETA